MSCTNLSITNTNPRTTNTHVNRPIVIVINHFGKVHHGIFEDGDITWNSGPQPDTDFISPIFTRVRVVTSSKRRNLFFIGMKYGSTQMQMFQMGCTMRECIWQPMIESISDIRHGFVAIIVPDELTECTSPPLDIYGLVFLILFIAIFALPLICESRVC